MLTELGFRGKRAVAALFFVILSLGVVDSLSAVLGGVGDFFELSGIGDVAKTSMKVVGTGYIFGIASDVCSELGEGGASKALDLAGKVEVVLIVLPYLTEVTKGALEMIK